MSKKGRVLCIDDDLDQLALFAQIIKRLGHTVLATSSPLEGLKELAASEFQAVVTDLAIDEMDGLALCARVSETQPDVPVVVITGSASMENAMAALRAGAFDFLTKPIDANLLEVCVTRAILHAQLRRELKTLKLAVGGEPIKHGLVGTSPAMRTLVELIDRVGDAEVSVVIQGETGTGKELVARAVHAASPRAKGPFVAMNCAAVPPALLESELFGHSKGAFTDASHARQGLFVEASGGTLFLDEIGEMSLDMQVKLLRALQERKVRPVGSNAEVQFDTRIVTATHRDLEAEVDEERFRADLFYRLNVVRIDIPPLRERGHDILKLSVHFLRSSCERSGKGDIQLSPQTAEKLLSYDWPGNVRELENCMERAVALARFDHIVIDDLPEQIRAYRDERFNMTADAEGELVSLDVLEQRYVLRTLKLLGGNKARAAQLLGIDRRTLYRKLESYSTSDSTDTPGSGG